VLSIPLLLATPARTGRFVLEVLLAQEGPVWHEPGTRTAVTVKASCQSVVPAHWLTLHRLPETYNYAVDHEIARVFVKEELARSRRPIRRILEVGGCSNPMTWDLPAEVVCADVDVQALQVGCVRHGKARPNIRFVAADAAVLPFADRTFDCAVVFAALHHLADPAHCLREMHRVVRRGGFVAVLCEPVGSYRAETIDAQLRKELAEGINEQVFTAEEYAQMFEAAGLVTSRAVIDGWSFKAILRRGGPLHVPAVSLARASQRLAVGLRALPGKAERCLKRLVRGRAWHRAP
jgi:SAM-dependent methyltransferase